MGVGVGLSSVSSGAAVSSGIGPVVCKGSRAADGDDVGKLSLTVAACMVLVERGLLSSAIFWTTVLPVGLPESEVGAMVAPRIKSVVRVMGLMARGILIQALFIGFTGSMAMASKMKIAVAKDGANAAAESAKEMTSIHGIRLLLFLAGCVAFSFGFFWFWGLVVTSAIPPLLSYHVSAL